MAINVISSQEPVDEQEELSYPVLMESTNSRQVVLFLSMYEGIQLVRAGASDYLGHVSDWVACTDKETWKKYSGTLTLSNQ